jgi:hypothetical protein
MCDSSCCVCVCEPCSFLLLEPQHIYTAHIHSPVPSYPAGAPQRSTTPAHGITLRMAKEEEAVEVLYHQLDMSPEDSLLPFPGAASAGSISGGPDDAEAEEEYEELLHYEGADTSPVTPRELAGWYFFSWAAEGYSALGTAVFFPIILQTLAAHSGFQAHDPSLPCDLSQERYECVVPVGPWMVSTTSFVFYSTTISVLIQFFLFIAMGALADYGNHRKGFMLFFALLTAALGLMTLLVTSSSMYIFATALFILSNVTFGASFVFYYAWVGGGGGGGGVVRVVRIHVHAWSVSRVERDSHLLATPRPTRPSRIHSTFGICRSPSSPASTPRSLRLGIACTWTRRPT